MPVDVIKSRYRNKVAESELFTCVLRIATKIRKDFSYDLRRRITIGKNIQSNGATNEFTDNSNLELEVTKLPDKRVDRLDVFNVFKWNHYLEVAFDEC